MNKHINNYLNDSLQPERIFHETELISESGIERGKRHRTRKFITLFNY